MEMKLKFQDAQIQNALTSKVSIKQRLFGTFGENFWFGDYLLFGKSLTFKSSYICITLPQEAAPRLC